MNIEDINSDIFDGYLHESRVQTQHMKRILSLGSKLTTYDKNTRFVRSGACATGKWDIRTLPGKH